MNSTIESVKIEILKMAEEDQKVRHEALKTGILDQTIDIKNTARMKEIVQEFGWLTPNLVGNEVSEAAWLLVQHADLDPSFQKQCLNLIETSYKKEPSNLLKKHIDKLTERVKKPLL
jgi:hypothetical protein